MRQRAAMYSQCIADTGASLDQCVGILDGTALYVSRPGGGLQRACCSGHKRKNAVKFQNKLTPDGLFFHLFGPVERRRHDMTLYHESQLDETHSEALTIDGHQFYLNGDVSYMLRPWLKTASGGLLTLQQEAHIDSLKDPRASVEWGFKDVKQVCSSFRFFSQDGGPRGPRRSTVKNWRPCLEPEVLHVRLCNLYLYQMCTTCCRGLSSFGWTCCWRG